MAFIRENLPEPLAYYESQGLTPTGPRSSKWKTTRREFHDGFSLEKDQWGSR